MFISKLFSKSTPTNENLLWEIESLSRFDSKLNQALIANKLMQLEPQETTDSLEGIIFLIEEKNQVLALKIKNKLTQPIKTTSIEKRFKHLEFGILLCLLFQVTILVRQHQALNLCSTTNIYFDTASKEAKN